MLDLSGLSEPQQSIVFCPETSGGLLVFPGFISDAIALVLLLIPGTWGRRKADPLRPANDDILEGEFKREPDDLLR